MGKRRQCGGISFCSILQSHKAESAANRTQKAKSRQCWEMLRLEEAFASLESMSQPPSIDNLAWILQKCRKMKNLEYVQRLHAFMCKSGLEAHRSLGNYLVPMLVEVGSMRDAEQVFNTLVDRNEFSWTSLITGYLECGESQHALNLYQKMQEDGVQASGYTFVALLKAFARLKDVERGQELHAEITRKGLERDIFVGSTLVDMYAKCNLLAKARKVFNKLTNRDAVSWNAIIAGYARHGLGIEALDCFEQMQLEGISPNAVTFVCSLKACGSIGAIDKGRKIHAEIARKGVLERDPFIGSALVDMYAKCGSPAKAREIFDKLSIQNEVSWTALLVAYAEYGLGEKALATFEQMQLEGFSPNALAYVCSLKACGIIGDIDKGQEIHVDIVRKGLLEREPFIGSALIDMYTKCNSLAKAQEVFDKLPVQDAVSWNALISGYAKYGLGEVLNYFNQMELEGVSRDALTFVCSLKACGSIGAIEKGEEIHAEIIRMGLERDLVVGSTLVDMYAKCGLLAKAQKVFDNLPIQDVVCWTALISAYAEHGFCEEAYYCFKQMQLEGLSPNGITFGCTLRACSSIGALEQGREIHADIARKELLERDPLVGNSLVDMYAKCGSLAEAREVFDKLPNQNIVSWTALIGGYAEHGLGEEALNCLEQMQLEGFSPDAITFVCSLKACCSMGVVEKGQEIHALIARRGLEREILVGSTLVDMYAKCGSPARAQEVFDKLPVRDVVLWTALIAGYARLGESENVFHMLEKMRGEGIKPNAVTFLSILGVCSHTGLVDKGQTYFETMSKDYGITPTIEHHACMVDLLGRAGQLEAVVAMMKKMPFHPNLVVWHTVMDACRKSGNVELGRQAFEHAVQLDAKKAAGYVMISNIYANAHMERNEKTGNERERTIMQEVGELMLAGS